MIIKGKALQLVRCERFKVIKAPRTCTIHEERGKTENLVYTSFQILVWGSPSVRICAQIWRSLLNLQQGTNVFHCADFWTKDFLMFKFCIFGFLEFEDFGREKWGWRPVSKKGRRLSVAWRWKLDSTIFYSACWLQCPFSCKASWQWQMSSDPLMIIYLIKQSILSSWTTITSLAVQDSSITDIVCRSQLTIRA